MVTNETKHPIFTPYFIETESGAAHTGRELGLFAPAEIKQVIHNIYSSSLVDLRGGYQGYCQAVYL